MFEESNLKSNVLADKTVLLTGGGGGIGFEAAKSLVFMGANVIIAEIDREKGFAANEKIQLETSSNRIVFYQIDISDEKQIEDLYTFILKKYGFLDVIFNNATVTPMGCVEEVSVADWDRSYAVNLRGPVLLVRRFLPLMKEKNKGTIVFVPSSGAAPFMGAYEVFKTSQVELCNTLAAELEKTDINVYSIGPGLVKTETAQTQIEKIVSYLGISLNEFYTINQNHILDVESAGAGFALSVAMADKYRGQEIGCIQVLMDAGIIKKNDQQEVYKNVENESMLKEYISKIKAVFDEQYEGWIKRNLFERQWVFRDFKKVMKLSAEQVKEKLEFLKGLVFEKKFNEIQKEKALFISLKEYYEHQLNLLKGYEKDPGKLEENSKIITGWIADLKQFYNLL